jgi:predicted RNase H-like HicB family nuclease
LHGPGHLSHYYIYLLKNDEPISIIARGNTPQEAIENAEKLKERLENEQKRFSQNEIS